MSRNIVSVSWADHLTFGEGDGRLETPAALGRRIRAWRDELDAGVLHWRVLRARIAGRFEAAPGYRHPSEVAAERIAWDDFRVVPELARSAGVEPWLYVSLFDEGFPLAPEQERRTSHHNAMHGQHVAWQSDLTRVHPEWVIADRRGARQWGVVCLAYPDARHAFIDRWVELLRGSAFEGVFVCLRSQSKPAEHGDQYGFNPQVRADFAASRGGDILADDFDVQAWRDLLGGYLTTFLRELRVALPAKLAIGVPRGDVLGPPLGNATLAWRDWLAEGLIDALVIDQNSSQCPSMWHQLWPMHRGDGYLQDYLTGRNLPSVSDYAAAALRSPARLYVARQWRHRSDVEERELLATAGVSGLVFSSFRHDNPSAVARDGWRVSPAGAATGEK